MEKRSAMKGIGASHWLVLLFFASTLFNQVSALELFASTITTKESSVYADSIRLLSPDVTCRGASPVLSVTGMNVSWYADELRTVVLARGNTYQAMLLDTTTTPITMVSMTDGVSFFQADTLKWRR